LDQRQCEYEEEDGNGAIRNFFSVPFTTYSGEESLAFYIKTATHQTIHKEAYMRQSLSVRPTARHAGVVRQHIPVRITEVLV
jgi:hypothetical protein